MHVFTSKKSHQHEFKGNNDAVKILALSEDMKVRMKLLSKKHGYCVTVEDRQKTHSVCTLLPIGVRPEMFRDEEYSQVVGQKKFQEMQASLFSNRTLESKSDANRQPLGNTPRKGVRRKWPESITDVAPFEQHTASLHTMFALDCAVRGACTTPNYNQC